MEYLLDLVVRLAAVDAVGAAAHERAQDAAGRALQQQATDSMRSPALAGLRAGCTSLRNAAMWAAYPCTRQATKGRVFCMRVLSCVRVRGDRLVGGAAGATEEGGGGGGGGGQASVEYAWSKGLRRCSGQCCA